MPKFIIQGTWCEVCATLHTTADSVEQAVDKYRQAFTKEQLSGLDINVIEVNDSSYPFIKEYYKEGYKMYFGGYQYDLSGISI